MKNSKKRGNALWRQLPNDNAWVGFLCVKLCMWHKVETYRHHAKAKPDSNGILVFKWYETIYVVCSIVICVKQYIIGVRSSLAGWHIDHSNFPSYIGRKYLSCDGLLFCHPMLSIKKCPTISGTSDKRRQCLCDVNWIWVCNMARLFVNIITK